MLTLLKQVFAIAFVPSREFRYANGNYLLLCSFNLYRKSVRRRKILYPLAYPLALPRIGLPCGNV